MSFFPWRGGAGPGGLPADPGPAGAILFRCVWLAHRSRDPLFAAVAMGVAGVFGAQTILNIGMCLYVAPVVGVTLPFFSYGGSSCSPPSAGWGLSCP
ncbi:MAG: FtsW/RodA/SpoVE family cell cycle protein [Evtepia gabavorous]